MGRFSHRLKVCAVATMFAAIFPTPGMSQGRKEAPSAKPKVDKAERASGVIVKVEPNETGESSKRGPVRLTINTDAIWSDWARDQVTREATQGPKKAAEKGSKSVGTEGEPETANSLLIVSLTPASKVETRFRTLTDETSKGSKTPSEARDESSSRSKSKDAKLPHFSAADLRPGLFVEIDFRRKDGAQQVSSITVIRPVSEPGVPTEPAKP